MADNVDNLVLEHLRAIRGDLGNVNEKLDEVMLRLQTLEGGIASIKSDIAHHYADIALVHSRHDTMMKRIERLEKRLELTSG